MGEFHEMIEGPKHLPHGRQVQIGWLGATGVFYPWPTTPTAEQEPGSYMPVYVDEDEAPKLIQVGWGMALDVPGALYWRLIPLPDGPDRDVDQPVFAWDRGSVVREETP